MATSGSPLAADASWSREARERIDAQAALVDRLSSCCRIHPLAKAILVGLEDTAALLTKTQATLEASRRLDRLDIGRPYLRRSDA